MNPLKLLPISLLFLAACGSAFETGNLFPDSPDGPDGSDDPPLVEGGRTDAGVSPLQIPDGAIWADTGPSQEAASEAASSPDGDGSQSPEASPEAAVEAANEASNPTPEASPEAAPEVEASAPEAATEASPPSECTTSRCVDGKTVQSCVSGSWGTFSTCPYVCENNVCSGVCVPGSTQCTSDTQVETCSSTGTWTTTTCTNACVGATCGGVCAPGATSQCSDACSDLGSITCGTNGQWGPCSVSCGN